MSLHFYSSVNDSCKYIQSSLQIEKTKIEFINVLKLYYSKIQLYFFKFVFLSNVCCEGIIIFMYESFLSTPGGYTFLHHSKGQKYKCFNGRAYLINKLLGDFPCEARLEMTINACILVDWFFQVQFPKK